MGKRSQREATGLTKEERIADSIARKKKEEEERRKRREEVAKKFLKSFAGIDLEKEAEE